MNIGDKVIHNGHWHVITKIENRGSLWLLSLEHKDAVPFLAKAAGRVNQHNPDQETT